jgi:hypothetical protein
LIDTHPTGDEVLDGAENDTYIKYAKSKREREILQQLQLQVGVLVVLEPRLVIVELLLLSSKFYYTCRKAFNFYVHYSLLFSMLFYLWPWPQTQIRLRTDIN